MITEHSSKIHGTISKKDVHAKMEVFYNSVMVSNRNISIVLLNSISNKNMNIALPLSGSGIRGLRFLKELKKGKTKRILFNDIKENFPSTIADNLVLNGVGSKKEIQIHNEDAVKFLLNQHCDEWCGYFDYIDIDPFGTPNPFLSAAVSRVCRNGILAVTATDTAALSGTYPKVTKRKYWSKSLKNYMMHEIGLRILIRKVQLLGVQFDKELIPILSYHKDHYFRLYFRSGKGKVKCDEILKQHQYLLSCPSCLNYKTSNHNRETCSCGKRFEYAGPLWTGKLFNSKLVTKMAKSNPFPEEQKFLDLLKEESKRDTVGFIDLHMMAKRDKKDPVKMSVALKKYKGSRTHFSKSGVKAR